MDLFCPNCARRVTVGDSKAGQVTPCPLCAKQFIVPSNSLLLNRVPVLPGPKKGPNEFTIACAKCSQELSIPEDRVGQTGRCLNCGANFQTGRTPDGTLALLLILKEGDSGQPSVVTEEEDGELRQKTPPFLTRSAAVVECPFCKHVERVADRLFNRSVGCLRCRAIFIVVVADGDRIPFDCPHCYEELEAKASKAGQIVRCVDCGNKVRVPESPVLVRLVTKGKTEKAGATEGAGNPAAPVASGAAVLGTILAGTSGPRKCIRCGRYLRNPSMYCHVCRKR